MTDISALRLWSMRALLALLSLVILFFQLLPMETMPRTWAMPDLLLALLLAWSLRRPEYAPIWLVAIIAALADFLLQRPPGLWAALVLISSYVLQSQRVGLRDAGFAAEWITVVGHLVAIALVYHLALALFLIPAPGLRLSILQLIFTAIAYPIVVGTSAAIFGITSTAPGELDARGQRI